MKAFDKKTLPPKYDSNFAPVALPSQTYLRVLKALTLSNLQATKNIDKLHRVRKIDENLTQNTIVKFKAYSLKKILLNGKHLNEKTLTQNRNTGSNFKTT